MPVLCGLRGVKMRYPVPLQTVSVHADLRGLAAAVTAELTYENLDDQIIECEFVFPLADTSAVYKLEVEISGQIVIAECKPKKEGEQIYNDAVSAGYRSAILESETDSSDVFRVLLGNLPPKEKAKVTIGYVQPVDREPGGVLALNFPNVLNPRYFPASIIEDVGKLEGKFQKDVKFVAASAISYKMTFDAKVNLGLSGKIASIISGFSGDNLSVKYDDDNQTSASVNLLSEFVPDHDFRIHITPANPWQPVIFVEPALIRKKNEASSKSWLDYIAASAWFEPKQRESDEKVASVGRNEYWLVIDRSGSMSGSNINNAKEALLLFVKSLPIGCKFNIVGFGSQFECLFPDGSVDYSDKNAAKAVKHANELQANMGGTEILQPLKHIYSKELNDVQSRFIIILTDGDVGNTSEVIALAKKNAHSSRIFAIGIGEGASTALVNGIARVSGGLSEFVRNHQDRLQAKVVSLLKATTNPSAENVKLEWELENATLAALSPAQLPSVIYHGHALSQFAVFNRIDNEGDRVSVSAKLTALINGNPYEFALKFDDSSALEPNDAMPLHRLAAKARLLELNASQNSSENDEAVAISLATGVLCNQTALVAVDRNNNPVKNADGTGPTLIRIDRPLRIEEENFRCLTSSLSRNMALCLDTCEKSDRINQSFSLSASASKFHVSAKKSAGCMGSVPRESDFFSDRSGTKKTGWFRFGRRSASSAQIKTSSSVDSSESTTVESLISYQKINGSWSLTANLAKFLGEKSVDAARQTCIECLPKDFSCNISDDLIATLIGVALLRRKFADRKDEWQMIEEKAVTFLTAFLTSEQLNSFVDALSKKVSM